MEDAAEALKLAFSVFVFAMALSIAFTSFNQSKQVSDIVISANDRTYLEAYKDASEETDNGRIVGVENLIPTLYRYYKENYSVEIINDTTIKELFDLDTERMYRSRSEGYKDDDSYTRNNRSIKYKELYPDGISWLGSKTNTDIKLRVDAYISSSKNKINNSSINYTRRGLDFNATYNQIFDETYAGNKQSVVDPSSEEYDGTFFTVDSGSTKIHLIYKET